MIAPVAGRVVEEAVGADMFRVDAGHDTLVCPVNCTTNGTMGKGLAKLFERRYPAACQVYKNACRGGRLVPGGVVWAWESPATLDRGKRIYFAATKAHWRAPSKLPWVESAAVGLVERVLDAVAMEQAPLRSLALPALGCGYGGLPWPDVRPILLAAADRMAAHGVEVHLYPPHEEPSR